MPQHWIAFSIVILALLIVDLAVLQRPGRPVSVRVAWAWTIFLAILACLYALYIGHSGGRRPAIEFLSGYLIEGSLSIDNLFVFLLLFRALRLTEVQQRRVLLWGVLGAIVLRGVLIVAGTRLLERFWWVEEAFGVVLALATVHMLLEKPGQETVRGPVRWVRDCCLRYASGTELAFSSLLLVIAAVEVTDLLFAVDSIPAVLAVTRDPWIAFTSNIFAILGLRSLYFAIASLLDRLYLLHYGLACILGFVAFKMLAAPWLTIAAGTSLLVIAAILAVFAILSKALSAPRAPSKQI